LRTGTGITQQNWPREINLDLFSEKYPSQTQLLLGLVIATVIIKMFFLQRGEHQRLDANYPTKRR